MRKLSMACGLASIGCAVAIPFAKHYFLFILLCIAFVKAWGWLEEEINPSLPGGPY
jgi:hypothetical protein